MDRCRKERKSKKMHWHSANIAALSIESVLAFLLLCLVAPSLVRIYQLRRHVRARTRVSLDQWVQHYEAQHKNVRIELLDLDGDDVTTRWIIAPWATARETLLTHCTYYMKWTAERARSIRYRSNAAIWRAVFSRHSGGGAPPATQVVVSTNNNDDEDAVQPVVAQGWIEENNCLGTFLYLYWTLASFLCHCGAQCGSPARRRPAAAEPPMLPPRPEASSSSAGTLRMTVHTFADQSISITWADDAVELPGQTVAERVAHVRSVGYVGATLAALLVLATIGARLTWQVKPHARLYVLDNWLLYVLGVPAWTWSLLHVTQPLTVSDAKRHRKRRQTANVVHALVDGARSLHSLTLALAAFMLLAALGCCWASFDTLACPHYHHLGAHCKSYLAWSGQAQWLLLFIAVLGYASVLCVAGVRILRINQRAWTVLGVLSLIACSLGIVVRIVLDVPLAYDDRAQPALLGLFDGAIILCTQVLMMCANELYANSMTTMPDILTLVRARSKKRAATELADSNNTQTENIV